MAKKSVVYRNIKREKHVLAAKKRRDELKKIVSNRSLGLKEQFNFRLQLNAMARDSSSVRVRNRCQITGRPRGYMRKFGVSRIIFRNFASTVLLPGVVKSSW